MGNCSKIPRTNSNEEIKVNGGVRNAHGVAGNGNSYGRYSSPASIEIAPSHANPYPNHRALPHNASPAPPYPGNQANPAQPAPPAHPLSYGYRPPNQSYNPQPQAPYHSNVQSIPLSHGVLADPNPKVSETKAVSRYCRIIDEKLTLVPRNDNLHHVNFNYKCKFPAKLTIHYFVREGFDSRDQRVFFYANLETYPKATSFNLPAGDNQSFANTYKTAFSSINKQLLEVADKATYPLVIEIECTNPANQRDSQVLINCYKIINHNGDFEASVIKQVIKIEGNYRTLSNFYGTSVDKEESECLICLTETKIVALLPCKHVCYCEECVKEVQKKPRNDCPVCRTPVNSFLKVNH